uniref:Uncharacterized protein n=2 Tax=unclassified Caudoviricetes TaxID=2788787 RepID=A0A8S5V056_9CAUD|nr:MAG TPA: hypothetical protein [Myoviridae sp. ctZSu31]DAF99990.1 MAG TPA: hypothetical protein [Myoviridae sp. ctGk74]
MINTLSKRAVSLTRRSISSTVAGEPGGAIRRASRV